MVYKATKEIAAAFEAKGIKHRINELSETSNVEAGVSGDNVSSFRIRYISSDDDSDVAVRVFSLVKVPEAKTEAMLEKLNDLNREYRFVRFRLDNDNEVAVSFDMGVHTANVGDVAVEIFLRLMKIVDDIYPSLMKIVWG